MNRFPIFVLPFLFLLFGIAPGTKAPDFTLKNQDGKDVSLSSFHGKRVILFFYPKDDSPGCTQEAQMFTTNFEQLKKLDTVVLGISRQDLASKKAFSEKNKLPFDLLSDPDGKVAKAYGISTIPLIGLFKRQSVLIGADGKVTKFYELVDSHVHPGQVVLDLKGIHYD